MGHAAHNRSSAARHGAPSPSWEALSSRNRGRHASDYSGAAYVADSLARDLDYDYQDDFGLEPSPSISVVPGAGAAPRPQGLPKAVLSLARLTAVVLVLVTVVCVVRVGLISAAASCALETREISKNIDEARSVGSELEVSMSVLSNPSRIKAQAEAMGMFAPTPEFSEQITLPKDIVVTDVNGRLSLSGSLAAMATQSGVS